MSPLDSLKTTCLVLAIAQILFIPIAQAATIIVNTTGDTDGNDQACTLREAIVSFHDLVPASKGCEHSGILGVKDTVDFDPGLNNQVIILVQDGRLNITKNLIINGLGKDRLTIKGSTASSLPGIFNITDATVSLNNLTISEGTTSGQGGGIVAQDSTVSLSNSILSDNRARGATGGGIFATSSNVSLSNSTLSGNTSHNKGGGIYAQDSTVSLSNSILSDNRAGLFGGGGIAANNSTVSLVNSTVSGNSTEDQGGGIFIENSSTVTLTNSTVSGNSTGENGGGISLETSSELSLFNSTVSSNTAVEFGGGIMSLESEVHFTNSTISENSASLSGGGVLFGGSDSGDFMTLWHSTVANNTSGDDGGGIVMIGGAVRFTNSIVSGNTAFDQGDEIGNLGAIFNVDRYNLFGDSSKSNAQAFSGFSPDPSDSDITATSDGTMPTTLASILETALKNNGGPTKTHALVVGSPAINSGNPQLCSASDQRGEVRSDGKCDIGSYEFIDSSCYVINTPADKTVVFCL